MTLGPIRIAYFTNSLVRGGAEEHILALLRGLDRRLFQPHLICPPEAAEQLGADLPGDLAVHRVSFGKPTQLGAAYRLVQTLRFERIEILHSHLFCSSLFASPVGKFCGVPVIIETPHLREQWRRGWLKGSFLVDRVVGRTVDYYIAVSEANARYLVEKKRLPEKKVRVIQNGCDLRRFDPALPVPMELKKSLGFGETDPVLVVLARLEPQKGHSVLLDAFPRVRAKFPSVRLVVVGNGALRRELEEKTRALGLEVAVRFVGYQSNATDWLALADFTVLPSFFEGLPLVAIESLAAGRTMVATCVDGTPEVIVNGKTGLTVPPGEPAALADAIQLLLRDRALRNKLALAGRAWVLEKFNQQRQIEETQQLYLCALGRVAAAERRGSQTPSPGSECPAARTAATK